MNQIGPFHPIPDTLSKLLAQCLHCLKGCRLALLKLDGSLAECLVAERVKYFPHVLTALREERNLLYLGISRRRLDGD